MDSETRLLVFDERPKIRATLKALLAPHYSLLMAESWQEFERLLDRDRPGAVLLGGEYPSLNAGRWATVTSARLPIVFLSEKSSAPLSPVQEVPDFPPLQIRFPFTPAALRARLDEAVTARARPQPSGSPRRAPASHDVALRPSNVRMDGLIVGLAHRLNTFLVSVKTAFQILEEKGSEEDLSEFMHSVRGELEQVEQLMGDLTSFGNVPSPRPQKIAVPPLLRTFLSETSVPGLFIQYRGEGPFPEIWTDPDRLRFALRMFLNYFQALGASRLDIQLTGPKSLQRSRHHADLCLDVWGHIPHAPSPLQARIQGLYLFLAQESLQRIRSVCQHREPEPGQHLIRIHLPTDPPPPPPSFVERRGGERRKFINH